MGWADWINIAGSIVDLAGDVAGLLGQVDENGDPAKLTLGTVALYPAGQSIYAQNLDPDNQVLLLLARPEVSGTTTGTATTPITLPAYAQGHVPPDIASTLALFDGGRFALTAIPEAAADTAQQPISFTIGSLAANAPVNIITGVTGSFSADGSQFTIESTGGLALASADVTVRGEDDTGAKLAMSFNATADDGTKGTVDIPPGVTVKPTVAQLDITLMADMGSIRRALSGEVGAAVA